MVEASITKRVGTIMYGDGAVLEFDYRFPTKLVITASVGLPPGPTCQHVFFVRDEHLRALVRALSARVESVDTRVESVD